MKKIILIICTIFLFHPGVIAAEIENKVYQLKVLEETEIFEISSREVKALQNAAIGEALNGLYKIELYRVRLSDGREGWINSGVVEEVMDAYFKDGYKYYTDEQHDNSINIYKKILKINPANAKAHFWLAKNYWKIGEEDLAEDELEQTLNLDEDDAEALQMRSQLDYIYFKRSIRVSQKANAQKEKMKDQPLQDKAKVIELVSNLATKKGTSISTALYKLSKLSKSLGKTFIPKGWGVKVDPKEKGKYLAHYYAKTIDYDKGEKIKTEDFIWLVDPSSGSITAANKNAEFLMKKW